MKFFKLKMQAEYLPRWAVLMLDLLLCSIAFWLCAWIGSSMFGYEIEDTHYLPLWYQFLIVFVV